VAPRVGEEEATIAVLSALESCPESSALADGAMGAAGGMNSGVSHGAVNGEGNER
jgi:hypothetical protein